MLTKPPKLLTGPELGAAIAEAIKKKGISKKDLADRFGVQPPSVQDWIKRGTIRKERLTELWEFFSDVCGPEHWGLNQFPFDDPDALPSPKMTIPPWVTRPVSLSPQKLPPIPEMKFGEVAMQSERGGLAEMFSTVLVDDSAAPDYPRGCQIIWSTSREAAPGRVVLVRDKHGVLHVRRYAQSTMPGQFVARAMNEAYATLESAAHGLKVVAVLKGSFEPDDPEQAAPV